MLPSEIYTSDAVTAPTSAPFMADFGDATMRRAKLEGLIASDAPPKLEWAAGLKEGIAEAQKQGKPLICVYEEDYCGWCKQFDKELSNPAVAALAKDAIFVKLSPSKDPLAKGLANSLGIDSFPTVSILDINGSKISERKRMTGFMTAGDFISGVGQPAVSRVV